MTDIPQDIREKARAAAFFGAVAVARYISSTKPWPTHPHSVPPEPKGYIGEPTPAPRGWKEPERVS